MQPRYEQTVFDDFVSYANQQIAILAIPGKHIVKFDETNIAFYMVSGITLVDRGSVKNSGFFQWRYYMVLLGMIFPITFTS